MRCPALRVGPGCSFVGRGVNQKTLKRWDCLAVQTANVRGALGPGSPSQVGPGSALRQYGLVLGRAEDLQLPLSSAGVAGGIQKLSKSSFLGVSTGLGMWLPGA